MKSQYKNDDNIAFNSWSIICRYVEDTISKTFQTRWNGCRMIENDNFSITIEKLQ
jgi:hypothetical protein